MALQALVKEEEEEEEEENELGEEEEEEEGGEERKEGMKEGEKVRRGHYPPCTRKISREYGEEINSL
jgi:DNA primase large subunit